MADESDCRQGRETPSRAGSLLLSCGSVGDVSRGLFDKLCCVWRPPRLPDNDQDACPSGTIEAYGWPACWIGVSEPIIVHYRLFKGTSRRRPAKSQEVSCQCQDSMHVTNARQSKGFLSLHWKQTGIKQYCNRRDVLLSCRSQRTPSSMVVEVTDGTWTIHSIPKVKKHAQWLARTCMSKPSARTS